MTEPVEVEPLDRPVRAAQALATALLGAALAVAPIAFGGVLPWTWATSLVLILVASVLASVPGLRRGRVELPSAAVLTCLGLVWAVLTLQLVPLPPGLLRFLAPRNAELIEASLPAIQAGSWQAASLDRGETIDAVLKGVMLVLCFWTATRLARAPGFARALLVLLLAVGVFEAFYGLVEQFAGEGRIFGWEKPAGVVKNRASGTYVNPNHFAGFLAMAIPAALVLAGTSAGARPGAPAGLRLRLIHAMTDPDLPKRVLLGATAVLLVVGLGASLSRGGALATGAGAVVAAVTIVRLRGGNVRSALVLGGIAALAMWLTSAGAERLLMRFDTLASGDELNLSVANRLSFAYDTTRMALQHPFVGVGAGAFAAVFPAYQSVPDPNGILIHAHSDYAQTLAELGFVGFTALGGGLVLVVWGVWRGAREVDPARGALACAALSGVTALAIHSFVDFNLRLPANALWGAALLGIAWGAGDLEALREVEVRTLRAKALAVALALFAWTAGAAAALEARADWAAQPFVVRARGDDRPGAIRVASLEEAVAIWPFSAGLWGELAAARWQTSRSEVIDEASRTAQGLVPESSDPEVARRLAETLVAARLQSDPHLERVAERALEEAESAVRLAPGDVRWTAVRDMIQGERPASPPR